MNKRRFLRSRRSMLASLAFVASAASASTASAAGWSQLPPLPSGDLALSVAQQQRVDKFTGPFATGVFGDVYQFSSASNQWVFVTRPSNGGALQIAAMTQAPYTPWIIDGSGNIQEWNGSAFAPVNPNLLPPIRDNCAATDIAVGPNGSAYVVACGEVWVGDNSRFLWGIQCTRDATTNCSPSSPAAVAVSVDPNGNPWIVDRSGRVWFWNGSAFVALQQGVITTQPHTLGVGTAITGAASSPTIAWGLGTNTNAPNNFGIFAWLGDTWLPIGGGFAKSLSVDPLFPQRVTVATSDGSVFSYTSASMSQTLRAVGTGQYQLSIAANGLAGSATFSIDAAPGPSPLFEGSANVGSNGFVSFPTVTVPSCPHSVTNNYQVVRAYDANQNIGIVYGQLFNRACN